MGFVIALNPAGFVETHRLPTTLGIILILQAILNHFKLQLADGTYDFSAVKLVDEKLRHAFVHQLLDTLLQLLGLHGVGVLDVLEHLGREGGQASVVEIFALGERVTNLEGSVVGEADDVAGPCLVDSGFALRHKLRGR